MADIKKTLEIIWDVEYSSDPKRALEVNSGESGLTYKGIYQTANPDWGGWKIIRQKLQQYKGDKKLVGQILHDNERLNELVEGLYKKMYWDKAKLDEVHSQQIANEIFIAGVNMGMKKAVMLAQRLVGVSQDGVVGPKTLKAINAYDDVLFDEMYDILEKDYYDQIVVNNPSKRIYAKGWRNRAVAV